MDKVFVKRFSRSNNLFICERQSVKNRMVEISQSISDDVHFRRDVTDPIPNEMYGVYVQKNWYRGMIKFEIGKKVIHLLDRDGVIDFYRGMKIRKIENDETKKIPAGQMKVLIYAIAQFKPDDHFENIFKEVLFEREVTAIFKLLEEKDSMVHETFAGDFMYEANNQYLSFRELLIQQQISIPKKVSDYFNRHLFAKRAKVFEPNVNILSQIECSGSVKRLLDAEVLEVVNGRFVIYSDILGEGSVQFIPFSIFHLLS